MAEETLPVSKPAWQSKTMLVNAAVGVLACAALFWDGAPDAIKWINEHGGEITMLFAVINMGLRLITKDKISIGE